jgi:hypothetical protein
MSSVLLPIYITESLHIDKLPVDIKISIIEHTKLFNETAIIPLLESSSSYFERRFQEAGKHFMNYNQQMNFLVGSKLPKDNPNVSNSLTELSFSGLDLLRKQLLESTTTSSTNNDSDDSIDNSIIMSILNAIDIIPNYVRLAIDPRISVSVTKPEYYPASVAYINIWVCIFALIAAIARKRARNSDPTLALSQQQENEENWKTKLLIQKCQENTWKLESYIETIEIETDSEQRAILERIKSSTIEEKEV